MEVDNPLFVWRKVVFPGVMFHFPHCFRDTAEYEEPLKVSQFALTLVKKASAAETFVCGVGIQAMHNKQTESAA